MTKDEVDGVLKEYINVLQFAQGREDAAKAIHKRQQEDLKELREVWRVYKKAPDELIGDKRLWQAIDSLAKKENWGEK